MINCIHVVTQVRENYGEPDAQHWKCKGGRTVVVTGFAHPLNDGIYAAAAAAVETVRAAIEQDNDMFKEFIIDWELADGDALTDDERLQLEYDGRVTYHAQRIELADMREVA